jgi:putative phosphoesterase
MKKIGLLSDTHGFVDPKIYEYFEKVDEIWHAGDVGTIKVIDQLREFKPVRGVYGNIDGTDVRSEFNEYANFMCENVNVLMTHIAGKPGRYQNNIQDKIREYKPDLFVCGHSHILLVTMDKKFNTLWMNPGSCGNKGFHQVKTILRFSITNEKIHDLEAIELGKRI